MNYFYLDWMRMFCSAFQCKYDASFILQTLCEREKWLSGRSEKFSHFATVRPKWLSKATRQWHFYSCIINIYVKQLISLVVCKTLVENVINVEQNSRSQTSGVCLVSFQILDRIRRQLSCPRLVANSVHTADATQLDFSWVESRRWCVLSLSANAAYVRYILLQHAVLKAHVRVTFVGQLSDIYTCATARPLIYVAARRHICFCFMAKSAFWRGFSALAPYTGVGPI